MGRNAQCVAVVALLFIVAYLGSHQSRRLQSGMTARGDRFVQRKGQNSIRLLSHSRPVGLTGGGDRYDVEEPPPQETATVTQPAPEFEGMAVMPDSSFKKLKLDHFKGRWLILLFYPLDFTFVCPTELTAFSDRMGKFEGLNASVVGVSIDSHYTHLQWTKTPRTEGGVGNLKYPLLSDITREIGEVQTAKQC
uniref:Thioredoxin domain-containing protein n=1 Tax=Amorphochlora amoebiformis TaxID=1561963 RepID=A0A7S0DQM3_9EUKA|mmetsp:Transcript_34602/g.55772  ORF Transcript_34602/g.55772 Transcript_34602/m.55772 type:complete len:193 (+) Transcript_34602:38-616(+)